MRAAASAPDGRIAAAVERVANAVRLLAWAAMAGGYCLMLWALSGSAYADSRTDAPCRPAALAGQAAQGTAERPERPGLRP